MHDGSFSVIVYFKEATMDDVSAFNWDEGRNCRKRKLKDYDVNSHELHKEILEFCDEISPHQSEKTMRSEVVQRVRNFIESRWPGSEVKVFGSFNTGLYLPTSDIDIVVLGNCALYSLELELRSSNMFTPGTLNVLRRASVPIIKYEDMESKVKIDISFNMESGLRSAEKVKEYLKQYPLLEKLLLVVKQYLYQQKLNEVYTGGIGSYSVILLIVSFFQHCPKSELDDGNLGVLLTNFFEFYGKKFDYMRNGIRLDGGGCYFNKVMLDNSLLIKDPADPTNMIKGAWDIWKVKDAFGKAFESLSWALNSSRGYRSPILSLVVSITNETIRDRRLVEERWGRTLPNHSRQISRPYTAIPSFVTLTHSSSIEKPNYKMPRRYDPPPI